MITKLFNLFKKEEPTVKQTENMGRGVFTQRTYREGETIIENYVIKAEKWEPISKTIFNTYAFGWDEHLPKYDRPSALALGIGSLINHSYNSNVKYFQDKERDVMVFVASKNIGRGEQLFINYGYDPERGLEIYQRYKSEHKEEQPQVQKVG